MYNPKSKSTGSRLTNEIIPTVKDKFSFLYLEFAKIVQDEYSIVAYQDSQKVLMPLAMINVLLLGPGTSVSHAAIKTIADAGCSIIWCGKDLNYIYSTGLIMSEYSKNLIIQAKCYVDTQKHSSVVRRMYQIRYPDVCLDKFSLQQMRGMEGKRVKELYRTCAEEYDVEWSGREYDIDDFDSGSCVNRLLTVGNQLLYDICQAAIISFGLSPGLGFIHNGHARSFVYDVADLYKEKMVIPTAFWLAAENVSEDEMRTQCRKVFYECNLMKNIAKDLAELFKFDDITSKLPVDVGLWDVTDCVNQGINYGK